MLFTIVNKEKSFRGLLFQGSSIPAHLENTSQSLRIVDARGGVSTGWLLGELEQNLCFVIVDEAQTLNRMRSAGFKLYRCRDMDTGRGA